MRRFLLLAILLAGCGGNGGPESAPATSREAPGTTTAQPEPPTEEEATTAETTPDAGPPAPEAPPGIPAFVAGYRTWTKLNDDPIPARTSDPHNGRKNVYVSRERRPGGRFPAGTVVVKDAVRPGASFVGLIAIMRKRPGADPAHRNWVFVEYTRDARGEPFRETASGAVCWSCHAGALDTDYVFTE